MVLAIVVGMTQERYNYSGLNFRLFIMSSDHYIFILFCRWFFKRLVIIISVYLLAIVFLARFIKAGRIEAYWLLCRG